MQHVTRYQGWRFFALWRTLQGGMVKTSSTANPRFRTNMLKHVQIRSVAIFRVYTQSGTKVGHNCRKVYRAESEKKKTAISILKSCKKSLSFRISPFICNILTSVLLPRPRQPPRSRRPWGCCPCGNPQHIVSVYDL